MHILPLSVCLFLDISKIVTIHTIINTIHNLLKHTESWSRLP